jgi:hypothetical protein
VLARNFFTNLAAHPVADSPGAVVVAAIVAARIAAIAVVTTEATEAAAQCRDFAALPVAAVNNATVSRADFLAGHAPLDAALLDRVRNAHADGAAHFVALGNHVPAGDALGALFRNKLSLVHGTDDVATFVPVAGLLDHVSFGDPFPGMDGAVVIAAAVRALGRRNLFLRVVLLEIVPAEGKSQHGCHSPSQHRHTNSLPDHAFSLFV